MGPVEKGFTLIELMIVVAIIGILAAIGLPAYEDNTIRAKMSEVMLSLAGCRTPISEVYYSGPLDAPGANGWGCEHDATHATKFVASVTTDQNGVITATVQGISAAVDGRFVTLRPLQDASTDAVFLPGESQSLYGWRCGAAGTTVALKYLPASCRG
ncbi:MAG TPA: pilin [Burkholderiales bacterium]|nr:pilin [Burkholderiales bacterium]